MKLLQQTSRGFRLILAGCGLDKGVIGVYLSLNMVNKVTRLPVPKQTKSIKLRPGLTVTYQSFSSQLGPYLEIFVERIYEQLSGFSPGRGQVVFDVGANIGFYTLRQARLVGPSGHVYAFEPNPRAFQLLTKNVADNGLTWVTCLPYAVSSTSGGSALLWSSDRCSTTGSLFQDSKRTGNRSELVETVCLDDFVETNGISKIDILKMDTEGAEGLIVEGGLGKAIPITRRIVMESHMTRQRVRELLKPLGFEMALDYRQKHVVYFTKPVADGQPPQ